MRKLSVALMVMVLCAACKHVPPVASPQPPPVVAQGCVTIAVSVYDGKASLDQKVPGVQVTITRDGVSEYVLSDGAGNASLCVPASREYTVMAEPDGFSKTSVALSFTSTPASSPVFVSLELERAAVPLPATKVFGRMRFSGRAFSDDSGPKPSLGASLFWLAWGVKNDPDRIEKNVAWLAAHDVDFVRAFGEVCGGPWSDREVRPDWPDYRQTITKATQLVNKYGMRVEWTIFAGGCYNDDAKWLGVVDSFIEGIMPVLDGVQFVEIANEQQMPSRAVMHEAARRVRSRTLLEVALSGTPEAELPALYAGSEATVGTVHFDRKDGDYGWRSSRQPWGYWELEHMPKRFVNNEPAGINGSVRQENDPVKLASDALVTWISGGAAYVLHHGAGIYGRDYAYQGGVRHANVWEQPEIEPALTMINAIRSRLPKDIANYDRANNYWKAPLPTPPFVFDMSYLGDSATASRGLARAFTAQRGEGAYTVVLGARGDIAAAFTKPVVATLVRISDGMEWPNWDGRLSGGPMTYLVISTSVTR